MAKVIKAEQADTVSLKLPHSLVVELSLIAKQEDRSRSSVVRKFLQEKIEDYKDLQAGLKALEKIKNNPNKKTYSSAEVMERLGISKKDLDPTKHDFSDCD